LFLVCYGYNDMCLVLYWFARVGDIEHLTYCH